MTFSNETISLFQQLADLTAPKCRECRAPMSCCSSEYCEMALILAKEAETPLEPTGHPRLKLMGPNGCVAPPHLRPLCTFHLCSINNNGYDKDAEFTKQYFELRKQAEYAWGVDYSWQEKLDEDAKSLVRGTPGKSE